jgi:hypothetical protein
MTTFKTHKARSILCVFVGSLQRQSRQLSQHKMVPFYIILVHVPACDIKLANSRTRRNLDEYHQQYAVQENIHGCRHRRGRFPEDHVRARPRPSSANRRKVGRTQPLCLDSARLANLGHFDTSQLPSVMYRRIGNRQVGRRTYALQGNSLSSRHW